MPPLVWSGRRVGEGYRLEANDGVFWLVLGGGVGPQMSTQVTRDSELALLLFSSLAGYKGDLSHGVDHY